MAEGMPNERAPEGSASGLTFRVAADTDIRALVELLNSAYRGDSSRAGWTTEADLLGGQRVDPAAITEALATPDAQLVLAERAGRLVGCCEVQHGGDREAYFGMFAVRPTDQGGGLGSRLLAEAERIAGEFGCARLRMLVLRQRGDLVAWYERRGYRRTGEESPFPYGDARYGLPKRDDLVFDELAKPLGVAHHADRAPT